MVGKVIISLKEKNGAPLECSWEKHLAATCSGAAALWPAADQLIVLQSSQVWIYATRWIRSRAMWAKGKKKKERSPCHGWYLSPLENHLCVPYDHLPPCLARRQMGYLAAAFLVCLEAEPSSSHHGVNAGTGRVLSPAMTPPWQLPINHFPRRAAPLSSQQHPRGRYKFYSFNPRYPALWHCVCRLKRMKRQMEVNSFGRQASIW